MTEQTYRFRGKVKPSAEVSRPAKAYLNAANPGGGTATSATLDIMDVIDSWGGWWGISARDVDAALAQVGDVDELYVRVNSPGGEATEGVAIANLLRAHAATVHMTVIGIAASAASYIATAGDVVTMAPGSLMMVHDAWNIAAGPPTALRKEAAVLDTISDSIAGLYALKAGGTAEEWRAVMIAETWYTADQAVAAGLADRAAADTAGAPAPVGDTADADDDEDAPLARAAARFDLTMFDHAPDLAARAALVTQAPADQPVIPSAEHKEAVAMTDTISTAGLTKALGLADDADEDTILEAVEAQVTAAAAAAAPAPAASAVPAGHTTISASALEELRIAAAAGAEARSRQLREDRDDTIAKAVSAGKIAAHRVAHWRTNWDKDPEGVAKDIADLAVLYPVATTGHLGGENSTAHAEMTDEEATELAALAGLPKGAI